MAKRGARTFRREGLSALFWKIFWGLPGSGKLLKLLVVESFAVGSEHISNIDEAWDFASSFNRYGFSIAPAQIRGEFLELCNLVREIKPHTIVEIGTDVGGTLFLLTRVAPSDAIVISVDMPRWDLRSWYSLHKSFARDRQRVILVRGDSHSPNSVEEVVKALGGRELDFLFIDGDHSYKGVKMDFENYSRFVRHGGVVAFHDINPDNYSRVRLGESKGGEVYRFWDEVKDQFRHVEYINDHQEDGLGIGILWLP